MREYLLSALIGALGFIAGALITILGSRYIAKKNHEYSLEKLEKEHKKRLEYLREERLFEERIRIIKNFMEMFEEAKNILEKEWKGKSSLKVTSKLKKIKEEIFINAIFLTEKDIEILYKGLNLLKNFNKSKKSRKDLKKMIEEIKEAQIKVTSGFLKSMKLE